MDGTAVLEPAEEQAKTRGHDNSAASSRKPIDECAGSKPSERRPRSSQSSRSCPPPPAPIEPDEQSRPATDDATDASRSSVLSVQQQAHAVERGLIPINLATATGASWRIEAVGYRQFLDRLIEDAGHPTDPVEIMLLERLAFYHVRSANLHAKAAEASQFQAIQLYGNMASRLDAEFRQTTLALSAYRQARPRQSGTAETAVKETQTAPSADSPAAAKSIPGKSESAHPTGK